MAAPYFWTIFTVVCCLIMGKCSHSWPFGLPTRYRYSSSTSLSASAFTNDRPLLAIITEPDACATDERVAQTVAVLQQALHEQVDLVSVRVDPDGDPSRVHRLISALVNLQRPTRIVVTSDWVHAALQCGAHGIHVKESHRDLIPAIRRQFSECKNSSAPVMIGTSAHSIASAQDALQQYQPDYLFVGTCYPTQTHPEKTNLEGPALPGQVVATVPVFAIGGIHADNCAEPVALGASGVAVIRAVLQAKDPASVVRKMNQAMQQVYNNKTSNNKDQQQAQ